MNQRTRKPPKSKGSGRSIYIPAPLLEEVERLIALYHLLREEAVTELPPSVNQPLRKKTREISRSIHRLSA